MVVKKGVQFPLQPGVGKSIESVITERLTDDDIRQRAHELWVAGGRRHGHDQEDWDDAKRQLRNELLQEILDHDSSLPEETDAPARTRPHVFVGSSSEGLEIAKTIQLLLDPSCEVTIWNQGVFEPSTVVLDDLIEELQSCDFAVLVFTPDDLVKSRGKLSLSARDNVILELGMFLGRLGAERTFVVYDATADLKMPTDLAGITAVPYQPPQSGNWEAALGASCTRIIRKIERLGMRT